MLLELQRCRQLLTVRFWLAAFEVCLAVAMLQPQSTPPMLCSLNALRCSDALPFKKIV